MLLKQLDRFAGVQIIKLSPILEESAQVRLQYYAYLKRLIRMGKWDQRKYARAQLAFYNEILCGDLGTCSLPRRISFDPRFCMLLPYDLVTILGYHAGIITPDRIELLVSRIASDFSLKIRETDHLFKAFEAAMGDMAAWQSVLRRNRSKEFFDYLNMVRRNIRHLQLRPFQILITATMSAGKSTLINALVGKDISRMQNMACTSKLHKIVSKPMDDGVTGEYDHSLTMNASPEELLEDNNENKSSLIIVGTYFESALAGKRIVLIDSPGVNSSQNQEHARITEQVLHAGRHRLILYVLNATQLGTNDESRHLELVRQKLGRRKIIFVMNKIDKLISEDEDLMGILERQKNFLVSKGFTNAMICPVSSRAAYLARKKQRDSLSRIEQREIENYMYKFEESSLTEYYETVLDRPGYTSKDETEALLINCGFSYLETILSEYYKEEVN